MLSPLIITIIGPPGSGKGTQGKLIAEKYNLNYIATGDIVRRLRTLDTPLGRRVRANNDKGVPQPDENMIDAFREEFAKVSAGGRRKGFLLDSFPLSMGQVKALNEILASYNLPENIVVYLEINADTVIKRIGTRLICSKCGAVFLPANPAFQTKKCDKCGGDLMERFDDKPEVVRRRIEEYKSRMADLKKYYQDRNRLIIINGEPSIEEIHKDIINKINEFRETKALSEKQGK